MLSSVEALGDDPAQLGHMIENKEMPSGEFR